MQLPQQKLDALLHRQAILERELSTEVPAETFVRLSREHAELGPVVDAIKAYRAAEAELADLNAMIEDSSTDPEMRRMAEAEKPQIAEKLERLGNDIRLALLPKDALDERNVI